MNRGINIAVGCLAGVVAVVVYALINPPPSRVRSQDPADNSAVAIVSDNSQDDVAEVLYPAPAFNLTDPDGKPFGSKDLAGKPYAVMFFFSECAGVCPGMTGRMRDLQKQLEGTDVRIVSFTVDPINDTPEKLNGHREAIGASKDRWHLLTGTPEQMIEVAKGFKLPYDAPVNHSSSFLLVDRQGQVRGIYGTQDVPQTKDIDEAKDSMLRMTADAKTLSAEPIAGAK
jgi:protein SCO1